ncbi:UvrD-helicase domain-containing protein [Sphingomonas mollis]|uniref:DNA 3'-5' helicase II n=1 Tax=Sphingomonas mollis TaxID=2795726 RepID=A0ABS0XR45_9SPHN|nr:UvrD-helicase domain-containing protein [Sphingomonas sp. BT553]MBJ6122517.1 UvrD-helicase domain-containing protein [Sphingomonas sp. BT553]
MSLFDLPPGAVVAPAGCGKTQTIVDALAGHDGLPVLVLTHTNAGVTALRTRLARSGVPADRYRLATIDGWALKLITLYPGLAGHRNVGSAIDYPGTQDAAVAVLESGVLAPVLRANYGRLVVDEYQDCSARQHRLVRALAAELPCHVLGDPLQCIFDFNGARPDWDGDVIPAFPTVLELDVPHRWVNAGQPELGQWILDVRAELLRGAQIDLRTAPPAVCWIQLPDDQADRQRERAAAVAAVRGRAGAGLLIIGDARPVKSRIDFARATTGVQVIEPVDMSDLITAAGEIEAAAGVDRLNATLRFVSQVIAGVANPLAQRINALRRGPQDPPASDVERTCIRFFAEDGLALVRDILEELRATAGLHVYRPHMLAVMIAALSRATARGIDLRTAAIAEREVQRIKGRPLPARGIGSTLLLKGLEGEHAIILDADPMTAQHLYVAISRASTSLTVFSTDPRVP